MHNILFDFDKALIVGDVHTTLETLELADKVLEKAHKEAVERNIPVLFLGDLFHHKAIIRSECLNLALKWFRKKDWKIILIVGNHDYENSDLVNHSLECFKDLENVLVIDKPLALGSKLFIPYMKDEDFKATLKNWKDIEYIFCHHGISGFLMNNVKKAEGEVIQKNFTPYKKVYCGHWHLPQEKKNIVYIGSPYQQNFGETEQLKRFLVFDSVKNTHEEIILSEFPKYFVIKLNGSDVLNDKHTLGIPFKESDHVRFDITGNKDECSQINKSLLMSKYSLKCDVRLGPFKYNEDDSSEVEIKDTLNYESMFEKWLNIQHTNLNKIELLNRAKELLNAHL